MKYSAFITGTLNAELALGKDEHHIRHALETGLAVGLAKESLDELEFRTGWPERHPGQGADWQDLAADAVGCAAGIIISEPVAIAVTPKSVTLTVRF